MNVLMNRAARTLTAPWKTKTISNTFSPPLNEVSLDYSIDAATASSTFDMPTPLRPGVVVYDGVCHLCHTGQLSLLYSLQLCASFHFATVMYFNFFCFYWKEE